MTKTRRFVQFLLAFLPSSRRVKALEQRAHDLSAKFVALIDQRLQLNKRLCVKQRTFPQTSESRQAADITA